MRVALLLVLALVSAPEESPEALLARGERLHAAGRHVEARKVLEAAERALLAAGEPGRAALARLIMGECLAARRRLEAAQADYQAAVDRLEPLKDRPRREELLRALQTLANCMEFRGLVRDALSVRQRALAVAREALAGDHALTVGALGDLGYGLAQNGRAREGLPHLTEALAMAERLGFGDDRRTMAILAGLNDCCTRLGLYEDALVYGRRHLAMARSIPGGDLRHLETALNNVASSLHDLERPDEAVPLFVESLAVCEKLWPDGHETMSATLVNLAGSLAVLGRLREAAARHERAQALWKRLSLQDHPTAASGRARYALVLYELGRFGEALKHLRAALASLRRTLGDEHPLVAGILSDIGDVLAQTGRPEEGLAFQHRALETHVRACGEGHPRQRHILATIATCLMVLRRPAEALAYHEKALAMARALEPDGHGVAHCLLGLGKCLLHLGRIEGATSVTTEALAILRRKYPGGHYHEAVALNLLGSCQVYRKRPEQALPHIRAALALTREHLPPEHPGLAPDLNNAALCMASAKRFDEALALSREALAINRKALGDEHPTTVHAHVNLGVILAEAGRYAQAREHLEHGVALLRRLPAGTMLGAFRNLARLEHVQGRDEAAAALLEEAIARLEEVRTDAAALDEAERGAYLGHVKGDCFDGMVKVQIKLGRTSEALRYLERGRARSLLDLLARSRFEPLSELEEIARARDDEKTLAEIAGVREALRDAAHEIGRTSCAIELIGRRKDLDDSERREEIRARTGELTEAYDAQREALRRRARLVRDLVEPAAVADPAELQQMLGEGERMLVYSLSGDRGLVLVVSPPGTRVRCGALTWPDGAPVEATSVRNAVSATLARIRRAGHAARGVDLAAPTGAADAGADPRRRLFRALVPEKLWAEIRTAPRVYIVAHGPLHRLPFEALLVGDGVTWLEEGPPVAYGTSGSTLRWCRMRKDRQLRGRPLKRILAVGDPAFGPGLARLPGTRREVAAIREAMGEPVDVLLGEDATESRLRAEAPRARILHLATHQIADETRRASQSRLALTLPENPTAGDDGFLRLVDLLEQWRNRLRGCELVVLSACETRRGEQQRDEGVYAMPWGFHYAGAPAVIASLWRVDDASTAELFADFYRRLKASGGKDKLKAFTEARKALRKKRPEPYFWAPFVYLGDPR